MYVFALDTFNSARESLNLSEELKPFKNSEITVPLLKNKNFRFTRKQVLKFECSGKVQDKTKWDVKVGLVCGLHSTCIYNSAILRNVLTPGHQTWSPNRFRSPQSLFSRTFSSKKGQT